MTDEAKILCGVFLGMLLGLVFGTGLFANDGTTSVKAYVKDQRVCIETTSVPDPCLTRFLPPGEAERMADLINAVVGRGWAGI